MVILSTLWRETLEVLGSNPYVMKILIYEIYFYTNVKYDLYLDWVFRLLICSYFMSKQAVELPDSKWSL